MSKSDRMTMQGRLRRVVSVAMIGALAGCASTSLVDMWRDEAYNGPSLRNVFIAAGSKDAVRRRIWEDAFVTALAKRGVAATPSYRIFPDPPTPEEIRDHVTSGHYDGIIMTKRAGRETRQSWVPGYTTVEPVTRYDPWWGTWGTVYREVYTPGYVETETAVRVQTMLFALQPGEAPGAGTNPDRLVWVGTSETIDPTSPSSLSREVSDVVVPELRKAKLVP